jgi:PKD repeat protein
MRRFRLALLALPAVALLTAQIVLAAPPTGDFTISDDTPVRGQVVNFDATAVTDPDDGGTITSYLWDFGDNTTSTEQNPSHAYSTLGPQTVTLTVIDSANETTVMTKQVTVQNRAPTASITLVSNPTPGRGQPITFNATASDPDEGDTLTYAWNFGNGATAAGQNVTYAYPANTPLGAKTVTLTVTDAGGATGVDTAQVTVQNRPPTASFTISNPTPARGQPVTFNATASDPDEGDTLTYAWNFGDGTTGTGQTPSHTYPANTTLGAKTVTLTVTDSADGTTTAVTQQVTIQNALPTASFSTSDDTPDIGQSVTFNGSASSDFEGPITEANHDWDLDGNGTFESSGRTPSRAYHTAGPVTVTLQVTDSNGATHTATRIVHVGNLPPTAAFTVSTASAAIGEVVAFDSAASNAGESSDTISRHWDLDNDGQFDDAAGPVAFASFATPGHHTVRLRVTDSAGVSATAAGGVTVRPMPPPPPTPPPQLIQGVVVRIKGSVAGKYTKVKRLVVRAPRGANVVVRCVGKSCPKPKKGGQASRVSVGRQLRFKQLERRMRSGTRIIVQVSRAGFVGRVTRFRMRTRAAPKRMDLCLPPGATKGTACPEF